MATTVKGVLPQLVDTASSDDSFDSLRWSLGSSSSSTNSGYKRARGGLHLATVAEPPRRPRSEGFDQNQDHSAGRLRISRTDGSRGRQIVHEILLEEEPPHIAARDFLDQSQVREHLPACPQDPQDASSSTPPDTDDRGCCRPSRALAPQTRASSDCSEGPRASPPEEPTSGVRSSRSRAARRCPNSGLGSAPQPLTVLPSASNLRGPLAERLVVVDSTCAVLKEPDTIGPVGPLLCRTDLARISPHPARQARYVQQHPQY